MLNHKQKQNLLNNWGEKANSLQCKAEVKIYDPLSGWECYIYALNPEDEDEIACIIKGFFVEICDWRLSEISTHFNAEGEQPIVDTEYRPRLVCELIKILNEGII